MLCTKTTTTTRTPPSMELVSPRPPASLSSLPPELLLEVLAVACTSNVFSPPLILDGQFATVPLRCRRCTYRTLAGVCRTWCTLIREEILGREVVLGVPGEEKDQEVLKCLKGDVARAPLALLRTSASVEIDFPTVWPFTSRLTDNGTEWFTVTSLGSKWSTAQDKLLSSVVDDLEDEMAGARTSGSSKNRSHDQIALSSTLSSAISCVTDHSTVDEARAGVDGRFLVHYRHLNDLCLVLQPHIGNVKMRSGKVCSILSTRNKAAWSLRSVGARPGHGEGIVPALVDQILPFVSGTFYASEDKRSSQRPEPLSRIDNVTQGTVLRYGTIRIEHLGVSGKKGERKGEKVHITALGNGNVRQ
ncbi:hypothetical protein JCM21900_001174 [Sporobolomyces salmonicolor]